MEDIFSSENVNTDKVREILRNSCRCSLDDAVDEKRAWTTYSDSSVVVCKEVVSSAIKISDQVSIVDDLIVVHHIKRLQHFFIGYWSDEQPKKTIKLLKQYTTDGYRVDELKEADIYLLLSSLEKDFLSEIVGIHRDRLQQKAEGFIKQFVEKYNAQVDEFNKIISPYYRRGVSFDTSGEYVVMETPNISPACSTCQRFINHNDEKSHPCWDCPNNLEPTRRELGIRSEKWRELERFPGIPYWLSYEQKEKIKEAIKSPKYNN